MSVILMSLRPGAPYADRIEESGQILIYEGHDVPRNKTGGNPKAVDQPWQSASGRPSQNKLFFDAAAKAKEGAAPLEQVRVYEKIRTGVWAYDGVFVLLDAWREPSDGRQVFKFKLKALKDASQSNGDYDVLPHNRLIPTAIKLEVWKRDQGRCVICGNRENLHFDHVIPFSLGGSSLVAQNIQLLCAKHNLQKHDSIL